MNTNDREALCKTFDHIFRVELAAIGERHNRSNRARIPAQTEELQPTTALALSGLTCSGGGIRSAAFCLGVLQGLQSKNIIEQMDYLSTVSGGGYVGTMLTIGMSRDRPSNGHDGIFPFGRLDGERRETPEVRHLRDNSRYLLQNGLPGVVSALVIYLRGIAMNVLVLLPLLLLGGALLVAVKPDTRKLASHGLFDYSLPDGLGPVPVTLFAALLLAALLVVYAVVVSVLRIKPLNRRQRGARIASLILGLAVLASLIELHTVLLRLAFETVEHIKPQAEVPATGAKFFEFVFVWLKNIALVLAPIAAAALPFLKPLAAKALEGGGGTWGDFGKRLGSRVILLIGAALLPVLLWLFTMQLAFWGIGIAQCETSHMPTCAGVPFAESWRHAPGFLQWLFGDFQWLFGSPTAFHWLKVPVIYLAAALLLFCIWPFLSVNSNSLHQLYRDRLGSAFLVRRQASGMAEAVELDDSFCLTDMKPKQGPYHLINTALNVPGSRFANRRGRNADFFLFSHCFIGSEATGYVETDKAERAVDGLNIGTAMAISGAAAAPNMGMASVRPLSPTIAFLNVRLGRWVRHPRDVARRIARLEMAKRREAEAHLRRIPGPFHLLLEAFAKSGSAVTDGDDHESKNRGFVFLTDGGHIENLGIYELLRRRCRLIIAIDGEADPNLDAASLVQVQRFARIDMNVMIRMKWQPIAVRTRAVSDEVGTRQVKPEQGPHVAVGLIDYPPASGGDTREKGVLVYIKASLSGDENDYVMTYKADNPAFPHETTAEQLFSEEQFEAYRALGEHIARRFVDGRDSVAMYQEDREELLAIIRETIPGATVT